MATFGPPAQPIILPQLLTNGVLRAREPKPYLPSFLFPDSIVRYTEFYCNASTGNNLNAGSDENGSALYTSTNGNWDQTANTFTPTDGSDPYASGVRPNMWMSIYLDAATVTTWVVRIIAVAPGANGVITVSSINRFGSNVTTGATGRSVKVGGCWKGPNGASGFPFNMVGGTTTFRTGLVLASSTPLPLPRINFKNNATYSITATIISNTGTVIDSVAIQGYTNFPGDGGKATIDAGTTVGEVLQYNIQPRCLVSDMIFKNNASSGTNSVVLITPNGGSQFYRCVVTGGRGSGFLVQLANSGYPLFIECEAYNCNRSNTAGAAGFQLSSGFTSGICIRCTSHDNLGTNSVGFLHTVGAAHFIECIAWNNGSHGFKIGTGGSVGTSSILKNCDAYNNNGDGLNIIDNTDAGAFYWIENCNFIANGGKGLNNTGTNRFTQGFVYNCGYGSNKGGNSTLGALYETKSIIYDQNITPWNSPATGDFSIVLRAAMGAGRGKFEENDGTNSGSVGYPDIGSAQSIASAAGGVNSTTTTLRDGYVNHTYYVLADYGAAFTISVSSGSLPSGLVLSQPTTQSFLITGTPTAAGSYSAVMSVENSGGGTGSFTLNITIYDDPDEGTGGMLCG